MRVKSDQRGFTLIEMLVVLTVISVVLSIGLLNMRPISSIMSEKMFVSQLKADLYFAQAYALSRQTTIFVQFYGQAGRYIAADQSSHRIIDRKLSANNKIVSGSNFNSYAITPDGNITRFGTMYFTSGSKKIKLVFNIGRGRFYVEE